MKLWYMSILFLLYCEYATISYSYLPSEYQQVTQFAANQRPSLQLTTSIISQTYCKGDADLDGVRLNLRLRFTNTSTQPLILYKGSSRVSTIMVSRHKEGAAVGPFIVKSVLTWVSTRSKVRVKGASPGKIFVILQPRESFEAETLVGIFATRDKSSQVVGAVNAGEYILQIEIPTWPESNLLAMKYHRRWMRSGQLWYTPIVSQPMLFSVAEQRKIEVCP